MNLSAGIFLSGTATTATGLSHETWRSAQATLGARTTVGRTYSPRPGSKNRCLSRLIHVGAASCQVALTTTSLHRLPPATAWTFQLRVSVSLSLDQLNEEEVGPGTALMPAHGIQSRRASKVSGLQLALQALAGTSARLFRLPIQPTHAPSNNHGST